jgi:hypothetical protein
MRADLEAAVGDGLPKLAGRGHGHAPAPGAVCANCGAVLHGPYCHACGQDSDTHKRSLPHLIWEAIEGLFHLDGRLMRTGPDLFLRPGRLARDYLEGRIARHVPPFRTFLVALLLFIFAAEHAAHELTMANARAAAARAAALATPKGRAAEAARIRAEAATERDSDLKEAAGDRADDLKDPDENRARVEAAYAKATARVQARYAQAMDKAARIAAGQPAEPAAASAEASDPSAAGSAGGSWWDRGIHKAKANPEYYLNVLFTWAHRLAILLLPIVGLSLALVYTNRTGYFFYDHLLVAMNILSFAFLTNALCLVLPSWLAPYGLGLVAIWTPINLFQTLRGAYGSSILGAGLKTLVIWTVTVTAFGLLLTSLLVFALVQL